MLETSKTHCQGREVATLQVDCFLPRCWIKSSFFKHKTLSPSLSFLYSALVWEDNAIIPVSQAIAGAGEKRGVKVEVSFAFQMAEFVSRNSCLSLNSAAIVEWVCSLAGFVFVHGSYYSPWDHEGLDGWSITRQCLLVYLPVPLTVAPH